MNADDFRTLFDYHFTINRKIWKQCVVPLTQEQFLQDATYSIGSIRNQLVHMMDIDQIWFHDLRGEPFTGRLDAAEFSDRDRLREAWGKIEADMQLYLDTLEDQDLSRVVEIDTGATFKVWQGLIHVINHGTDHRAQLLALLHSMGHTTLPQDYADYFWNVM